MKKLIFAILLIATYLFGEIYDEAAKKAINEKKLILVEVSSKFCPYCMKMNLELFSNRGKMDILEKKYLVLRFKKGESFPDVFSTEYYPTYFFVNPATSQIVDEFPGYMRADDFLEFALEVAKQELR